MKGLLKHCAGCKIKAKGKDNVCKLIWVRLTVSPTTMGCGGRNFHLLYTYAALKAANSLLLW